MNRVVIRKITIWSVFFIVIFGIALISAYNQKPVLPPINDTIHLSMRTSLLSSSAGVLQIRDNDDPKSKQNQAITIELGVKNLDNQQQMAITLQLNPGEVRELSWADGWNFKPNERIDIRDIDGRHKSGWWLTTRIDDGEVGIKTIDEPQ